MSPVGDFHEGNDPCAKLFAKTTDKSHVRFQGMLQKKHDHHAVDLQEKKY